MVCRKLQPASELSAVNVAVKYHVRCIEGEGELPTLEKKYARGGNCRTASSYGPIAQLVRTLSGPSYPGVAKLVVAAAL